MKCSPFGFRRAYDFHIFSHMLCSDIFTKSRERTLGSTSSQTAMNWIRNVSNMGVGNCVTR